MFFSILVLESFVGNVLEGQVHADDSHRLETMATYTLMQPVIVVFLCFKDTLFQVVLLIVSYRYTT